MFSARAVCVDLLQQIPFLGTCLGDRFLEDSDSEDCLDRPLWVLALGPCRNGSSSYLDAVTLI